jgi:hypothetical protein
LEATGLTVEPGELAWKLVLRALRRGMFDLIDETKPFPPGAVSPDPARLTSGLERALGSGDLAIDRRFFDRPADLPLLATISSPLLDWLVAHGAAVGEAEGMIRRLPVYFTYALHQEWHERAKEYAPLLAALDTPFSKSDERERAWERYAARLQRQIHEPMLDEVFGLVHVYVPLRGYYEEQLCEPRAERTMGQHRVPEKPVRHVVNVREALDAWIDAASKDGPALRVISGGPGSCKSSLAKMFAAHQAAAGMLVLYVPLHLIDPEKDLEAAIWQYVRQQDILPSNPLDPVSGERRLLVLLDGLDELAMQGKAAAEVVQKFVEEARRLTHANLARANLNDANLNDANLEGTRLEGANLKATSRRSALRKLHE